MTSSTASKIICDRYGVPQYAGEVEAFEEYVERAWDLYFGREGQESQVSTPIHLRSGLHTKLSESWSTQSSELRLLKEKPLKRE